MVAFVLVVLSGSAMDFAWGGDDTLWMLFCFVYCVTLAKLIALLFDCELSSSVLPVPDVGDCSSELGEIRLAKMVVGKVLDALYESEDANLWLCWWWWWRW